MLTKSARWYFPGQDVQSVINHIGSALHQAGVSLAQNGPQRWEGIGPSGSYGMAPKIWLNIMPDQGGFWLDVRVWAEMDAGFMVLFAVAWMGCFPAALVLLLLGNTSWTHTSQNLLMTMQHPVAHLQSTPNWGHPPQRM